jgi:hypothetical protein
MTYKLNQKNGTIIDAEDGQLIATMSDSATKEQGVSLVKAYNQGITQMPALSPAQISAIRCVYADMVGVYQCAIRDGNGGADNGHDWKEHKASIIELETSFPDVITDPVKLDDSDDDEESEKDGSEAVNHFATILMHNIKFRISGEGAPSELDETSEDNIENMIKDGYREGELNVTDGNTDTVYRGWWSIH